MDDCEGQGWQSDADIVLILWRRSDNLAAMALQALSHLLTGPDMLMLKARSSRLHAAGLRRAIVSKHFLA